MMVLSLALLFACSPASEEGGPEGDGGAVEDSGSTEGDGAGPPGEEVAAEVERDTEPDVSGEDLDQLTLDNLAFGLDLYQGIAAEEEGNVFLSPHSVSVAMAMTYAGAEGSTETQLAEALRFTLPEDQLHPAFNALDLELESRESGDDLVLDVVDQLFGQTGYGFEADYLDTLARHYGAGMRLLDFASDPDGNRGLINDWVAEVTRDRIVDLLPEGSVTFTTRLVLVNAIYFKGRWQYQFEAGRTRAADFTTLDGTLVSADTMHGELRTQCGSGDGYVVADLPYRSFGMYMTLLVPDAGRFEEIEAGLDAAALIAAFHDTDECALTLALPKFQFSTAADLQPHLAAMGMVDAFDEGAADFSDVTTQEALHISGLFHQAFVAVDEEGTEAAAATGETDEPSSEPDEVELDVDRPFLFFIRDNQTEAVLFVGRVADPTE